MKKGIIFLHGASPYVTILQIDEWRELSFLPIVANTSNALILLTIRLHYTL